MLRLFSDSEGYYEIFPVKAIGMVWDTMGTNPYHYELIKEFYDRLMYGTLRTPYEMYQQAITGVDGRLKINKMVRRVGLSPEQMFGSFPTLDTLQERHKYDKQQNAFGGKGDWMYSMRMDFGLIAFDEVFHKYW